MRTAPLTLLFGLAGALSWLACSTSPPSTATTGGASATGTGSTSSAGTGGSSSASTGQTTGAGGATTTGAGGATTTGAGGGGGAPTADTLDANRERLLGAYFQYLKASVVTPQSNGLAGGNVSSVCDVWTKLDPSSRHVFLTLTARMQGGLLGDDGSSMLSHITAIYRIVGGEGATQNDPGSCGGGEFNRMIMSMDPQLHASQIAASANKGAVQANGKRDISDIPAASFWRDSHDLGGAHAPFDRSDETEQGAPRGQTQYFADPSSALAQSPLGRMDLMTLVDPFAIEMDQDYDCVHASNPDCSYVTYKPLCFPGPSTLGTDLYTQSYGSFEPDWQPSGCGG